MLLQNYRQAYTKLKIHTIMKNQEKKQRLVVTLCKTFLMSCSPLIEQVVLRVKGLQANIRRLRQHGHSQDQEDRPQDIGKLSAHSH